MPFDERLSNVIGTPFPKRIKQQIDMRVNKNTLKERDNPNLVYLMNQTSWVRLVSSVDFKYKNPDVPVSDIRYFENLTGGQSLSESDLAKKFVLFGGISAYTTHVGGGYSYEPTSGFFKTYNIINTQDEIREYGYRPMPGLTSVTVETMGRLGSLRKAKINFSVWDKYQLDVIDMLYFKLGYSMLLEFGHTHYYDNTGQLRAGEEHMLDPFERCVSNQNILMQINENIKKSDGNYDAMLGIVTNFTFASNPDAGAGYDCTLELISGGVLGQTAKINHPTGLPEFLQTEIDQYTDILYEIEKNKQKEKEEAEKLQKQNELDNQKSDKLSVEEILEEEISQINTTQRATSQAQFQKNKSEFIRQFGRPSSNNIIGFYDKYDIRIRKAAQEGTLIRKFGQILFDDSSLISDIKLDMSGVLNKYYNTDATTIQQGFGQTESESKPAFISRKIENLSFVQDYDGPPSPEKDDPIPEKYKLKITINEPSDVTFPSPPPAKEEVLKKALINCVLNFWENKSIFPFFYVKSDSPRPGITEFTVTTKHLEEISIQNTTPTLVGTKTETKQEKISFDITIVFDDTLIISDITPKSEFELIDYLEYKKKLSDQNVTQNTQTILEETKDNLETQKQQLAEKLKYTSNIEIILRAIQLHSVTAATKKYQAKSLNVVLPVKLYEPDPGQNFAKSCMKFGVFSDVIQKLINTNKEDVKYEGSSDSNVFKLRAKFGFATEIMNLNLKHEAVVKALLESHKDMIVDYKELFTSYVVPYQINQDIPQGGVILPYPTYIPMSTLFMLINHMCLLVQRSECDAGSLKLPYFYMDFNPNTNYCLSHPCQLSTDPFKFLISFNGSDSDYKKIFDKSTLQKLKDKSIFKPQEEDAISGTIPQFKERSPYIGKLMNVLINCDYVIEILSQYAKSDSMSEVFFQDFIEKLLSDLNKSTGNFNIFSLAYNDSANTYHIVDSQYVPLNGKLGGGDPIKSNNNNYNDLPLLGLNSIAKSLEVRSEISSKLSNVIAISANSTPSEQSQNSIDATAFGYLNTYLSDRYAGTKLSSYTSSQNNEISNTDVEAAELFNDTIRQFYATVNPSPSNVPSATNYYINRLSRARVENPGSRASAMIPITINFTTHGISGIPIFSAFTAQDSLLPYSYTVRNVVNKDFKKVGFVVVGKTETIDSNNVWNTSIRGQMLPLKDSNDFIGSTQRANKDAQFKVPIRGSFPEEQFINYDTKFVAENNSAKVAADTYLGRTMSQKEWNELVAATKAEASVRNNEEKAWVMGVILNRTRSRASTVTNVLREKFQFQAVTGTSANGFRPSKNYVDGPNQQEAKILYKAITDYLANVPKTYIYFTSKNIAAYGKGTKPKFLTNLKSQPQSREIGDTIFSITAA
jgi:spore germination cell wall hydrolase CwlJ-like protein